MAIPRRDVLRDPFIPHLIYSIIICLAWGRTAQFLCPALTHWPPYYCKPIIPSLYTVHNSSFAAQKDSIER